jgi:hypothetical protein
MVENGVGMRDIHHGDWSAVVQLFRAGSTVIEARILNEDSLSKTKKSATETVNVTLDSATADITITLPAAGRVNVGEGGTDIALQATTSAGFGPRRVTWAITGPNSWLASGGTTRRRPTAGFSPRVPGCRPRRWASSPLL